MKWFRFYHEALHDPKVQRLRPALFKHWVNVLCLAAECDRSDGVLPEVDDIAFALRVQPAEGAEIVAKLAAIQLLDRTPSGRYFPHNWPRRQCASDDAAARQRKHRRQVPSQSPEKNGEMSRDSDRDTSRDLSLPQERDSHALDSDSERDSDTDSESLSPTETESALASLALPPVRARVDTPSDEGDDAANDEAPSAARAPRVRDKPAAIQVYLKAACRRSVLEPAAKRIVATVGNDEGALQLWEECVSEWVTRGYQNDNVRGMLDWYRQGGPPERAQRAAARLRELEAHPPPELEAKRAQRRRIDAEVAARLAGGAGGAGGTGYAGQ